MMKTLNAEQAMLPTAKANRPNQLAGQGLALGLLLLMAVAAQPAAASCGGTTTVGTETELNAAIAAFNAATTPCVFTIQLSADIPLTASTTRIANATSGVELVIEGNRHELDGQGTSGVLPLYVQPLQRSR